MSYTGNFYVDKNSSIFSFIATGLCANFRKVCPIPKLYKLPSLFSTNSFILWFFKLKWLIDLKFTFVYGVNKCGFVYVGPLDCK